MRTFKNLLSWGTQYCLNYVSKAHDCAVIVLQKNLVPWTEKSQYACWYAAEVTYSLNITAHVLFGCFREPVNFGNAKFQWKEAGI